ncbi:MAG: holin, BlyA family protein [Lachnospiraceae bacterium]|nr:holin, BlyA family protein [Lachnospiraceae bacterium]
MGLIKRFFSEEEGLSTVEIILILVVLIGLVLIFKDEMVTIVKNVFKNINNKITQI